MQEAERSPDRSDTVAPSPVLAGPGLVCLTVTRRTSHPNALGEHRLEGSGPPGFRGTRPPALGTGHLERGGAPMPWFDRSRPGVLLTAVALGALATGVAGCGDDYPE